MLSTKLATTAYTLQNTAPHTYYYLLQHNHTGGIVSVLKLKELTLSYKLNLQLQFSYLEKGKVISPSIIPSSFVCILNRCN